MFQLLVSGVVSAVLIASLNLQAANAQVPPASPNITSVQVIASTSVKVSWSQQAGGGIPDNYQVVYERATGVQQQGDCPHYVHGRTVTTGGSVLTYTLDGLEEFSTYLISVVAQNSAGRSNRSDMVAVITPEAAPTSPPESLVAVSVNSTMISLHWNRINCIDRNSEITGYRVMQLAMEPYSYSNTISVPGTALNNRRYNLTGVIPAAEYSIAVAAVNRNGSVGPFTESVIVHTHHPEKVGLFHGREVLNHGIVYLQDIGERYTAVLCLTNNTHCCSSQYTHHGYPQGQWYFPNGTGVVNNGDGWEFYRDRRLSVVRMNRRSGGVVGLYRCEIPDANEVYHTLYIGLYNQGTGIPVIDALKFHLTSALSDSTPTFNLTLMSTGGPITSVTWMRDGASIPRESSTFKTVVDAVTATYHNNLTVSGKYLGVYRCVVTTVSPDRTVTGQRSLRVVAAESPTNLIVEQEALTSIRVSWTPPVSGATVTGYRIYYQTEQNHDNVDVGASATRHVLMGLRYGFSYAITIVTVSRHIPSPLLGPVIITLGKPGPVQFLSATAGVSSILVTWSAPEKPNGDIIAYEVEYYRKGMQEMVNTTNTSIVLSQLKPSTLYNISVRAYTIVQYGDRSFVINTTQPHPVVRNVQLDVINATVLNVSWDAIKLPQWEIELSYYTLYYMTFSPSLYKSTEKFSRSILMDKSSDLVVIDELLAGVKHQFQVTVSLEIQGLIREGRKSEAATLVFDEAAFQLQMGPVTPCITWSVERALKIESYIHSEVTQAISEHCNCSFSMEFIRNGVFRCWNASNEVTYRSTIVGTKANNATQLVQFLQEWVNSEPVLLVEIFELWVDTKCPVRLSSFKLRGKGDCV